MAFFADTTIRLYLGNIYGELNFYLIFSLIQMNTGFIAYYIKEENLQHHIHEVVPEEYQKCIVGMD
jgi:hypothetical protein